MQQAEPREGYLDDEFARFRTQRLNKDKEPLEPNARTLATATPPEEPRAPGRGTGRLTKLDEMLAARREEARAATVRLAPVEAPAEGPPPKHHPSCALLDLGTSAEARCNCDALAPGSAAHRRPSQAHRRPDTKALANPLDPKGPGRPASAGPDAPAAGAPKPDSKGHPRPDGAGRSDSRAHGARLEPEAGAEATGRGTRRIAVLPPEEAGDDFERFRAQRLKEAEAARHPEARPAPAEPRAQAEPATVDAGLDAFETFRAQRLRDGKRHRTAALAAPKPPEAEAVDPEFERFRAERERALEEQRRADEALAAVPVVERPAETPLLGAAVEEKASAADDGLFFGTNHRERIQISAATREHRGDTPAHGLDVHADAAVAAETRDEAKQDEAKQDEAKQDEAKQDEARRRAPPPPLPTR